jgi:hypothetical protein
VVNLAENRRNGTYNIPIKRSSIKTPTTGMNEKKFRSMPKIYPMIEIAIRAMK